MYGRLDRALQVQPVFAVAETGSPLRDWFILTVIGALEAAMIAARPSPWRPLPVGEGWITVGINERFTWRPPFEGFAWLGHYYVLELRPIAITRAVRKATRNAIAEFEESLASLSEPHRAEILRKATQALEHAPPRTHSRTGT
jgi:hypothetical protein